MGRFSKAVFGREILPKGCLIYAGAYVPERKNWIRAVFDKWHRIGGYWARHCYAFKNGKEYLLIFNIYGAAMVLEILYLLKDGDVRKVFFIGSMGGKDLPIGTIVLPTKAIDKTGIVSADDANRSVVKPNEYCLGRIRETLADLKIDYVEGEIVSVPCVLHNLDHIKSFIEQETSILGMDIETAAYYYYSQKEALEGYALLYISDNRTHDVISIAKDVQEARRKSLRTMTLIAARTLE